MRQSHGKPEDSASPAVSTSSSVQPETATPEQLASVIASNEEDWRETIEEAGQCRILWVLPSDDAIDQADAFSCYMREQTMVLTTDTAARDLRELTPPESMQTTYDATLTALDAIAAVDLEGACGQGPVPSTDQGGCDKTLGTLYAEYRSFETALDQWRPYM